MNTHKKDIILNTVDLLIKEGKPENVLEDDFKYFLVNTIKYLEDIEDYERCQELQKFME